MRSMQAKQNSSSEGKQGTTQSNQTISSRYTTYPIISLKQQVDQSRQYVKFQIFLPGFLRLQLKNVTKIQLENLKGEINATLIFTIYYGDLLKSQMLKDWMPRDEKQRKKVQDSILDALKNQFCIQFFQGQSITLTEGKKMAPRNADQYKKLKQQQQVQRNLEVTVKHQEEKKQIKFSVRRLFEVSLQSSIFWTPFNFTYCSLSMTVQPLQYNYTPPNDDKKGNKKLRFNIEVNLLDTDRINEKFSHTQVLQFGEYSVACSLRKVLYYNDWIVHVLKNDVEKTQKQKKQQSEKTNKLKQVEEDQQRIFTKPEYVQYRKAYREKLKNFDNQNKLKPIYQLPDQDQKIFNKYWAQTEDLNTKSQSKIIPSMEGFRYACFVLPLFKHSRPFLVSILLPVVFLAVLNLFIFFQDPNLATRICSIATLMVAFISLFPTIRAHTPPSSEMMILEFVVLFFIYTTLITLVQSLTVVQYDGATQQSYSFVWYESTQFLLALIIDIVCVMFILGLALYHACSKFRNFKEQSDDYHEFDREQWKHDFCESSFNDFNEKYSRQNKVKLSQDLKVVQIKQ